MAGVGVGVGVNLPEGPPSRWHVGVCRRGEEVTLLFIFFFGAAFPLGVQRSLVETPRIMTLGRQILAGSAFCASVSVPDPLIQRLDGLHPPYPPTPRTAAADCLRRPQTTWRSALFLSDPYIRTSVCKQMRLLKYWCIFLKK